jgi:energy-coupling factor transporter ATP-binding protein EcfA2
MDVSITSVEFTNYKALGHFSLSLQDVNILVGPNNCGKSTIIGAFRVLAAGLRKARSQNAERVIVGSDVSSGYRIPREQLDISTENIHTDYREADTSVLFRLSNGNRLRISFPEKGDCVLVPESQRKRIASPTTFKVEFPISLAVVPVLGPLEHEEAVVKPTTVQRNLQNHRASRHFRNFWFYYPEGFPEFASLVAGTWPGMEVEAPEQAGDTIVMFCREKRITRELFWSGFGFQVWCQLLTHVARAREATILVVDEPEVYLHPDVQRQLLGILRTLGPNVLLATHSTEIMSEADPSEIVLIDKTARSGERLKDVAGVQAALEEIGSLQNITLARLARSRRVVFVEGGDFSVLTKFARILGMPELASGTDIVPVTIEGFSGWERVRNIAWGINRTLGTSLLLAAVLDRDYYPEEELETVRGALAEHADIVHIHARKELENYLLVPSVIERAIRMVLKSSGKPGVKAPTVADIEKMLDEISRPMKNEILGQLVAKRWAFLRSTGVDQASITAEVIERFDCQWPPLEARLSIVPGKEVLKRLRERVREQYGITLTTQRIVTAFRKDEIAEDLKTLLDKLEVFRTKQNRASRAAK